MDQEVKARSKPLCTREDALAVLLRLREKSHVAYFAGGCVRDFLMGLQSSDYDVATDAPPARVREIFPNTQAVGAAFGVILVRQGRSTVEVATFRSDGSYADGRRPSEVRFTDAREDAQRRDFTMNGLFLDPVTNEVIDYVDGQKDLAEKRLRAIGNPAERFAEDHLRLLRAIRFAARFGFEIESATAAAIRQFGQTLKRISPERIADELRLMLTPVTRNTAWEMLWEFELVKEMFRFLPTHESRTFDPKRSFFLAMRGPERLEFGAALAAAVLCYQLQPKPDEASVLAALAHTEIRKAVHAMRQALRISNEEADLMEGTLEGAALLLNGRAHGVATLKRFLARPSASASRRLLRAIATNGLFQNQIVSLEAELAKHEKTEFAPVPLLTGDDLIASGLSPGPMFKKILDAVYDSQLENRISTHEQAMELAKKLAAG